MQFRWSVLVCDNAASPIWSNVVSYRLLAFASPVAIALLALYSAVCSGADCLFLPALSPTLCFVLRSPLELPVCTSQKLGGPKCGEPLRCLCALSTACAQPSARDLGLGLAAPPCMAALCFRLRCTHCHARRIPPTFTWPRSMQARFFFSFCLAAQLCAVRPVHTSHATPAGSLVWLSLPDAPLPLKSCRPRPFPFYD